MRYIIAVFLLTGLGICFYFWRKFLTGKVTDRNDQSPIKRHDNGVDSGQIMGKSKVDLSQLKPLPDRVTQDDKTIKTHATFDHNAAGSSINSSTEPVFDCEQVEVYLDYDLEGEDEVFDDDDEIPFEKANGYSFEQMSQVVQLFQIDQSVEMVAEAGTLEMIKDLESTEFFEQLMNEKSANASRIRHLIESYVPMDVDLPEDEGDESEIDAIDSDFDINNYL
ncbi:MAG TPA: hypothetical protein PK776_06725 [Flavobacterium sp.]|nr:hypothetical protein [Flavobacterium sp.]